VVPAVEAANFSSVANLAASLPNCVYALGIHPLYVPQAAPKDLNRLREAVKLAMADERFVGIGEIGLDFFVPELTTDAMREKQTYFYVEQLKIAREFDLPVILHVRRSQDMLLKHLRRISVVGGIAHAFNGSEQQAQAFISLGFALGFGGAMTFTRALQIRRLATQLPLSAVVLETDAPDISPAWLHPGVNTPAQLPRIAAVLAELRGQPLAEIAAQTSNNVARVLPRLGNLMMQ
jgi:TatD DNase family protein